MKKILSFLTAAVLLLPLTVLANGENNGPKCNNRSCNETTNYNDSSTTNKAYGGDGGSAYSKAYGGNAKAYGGSAYQGQSQGQVGIVKNVGPQVVVTDQSVYEAQERDPVSSAYGHASHRYECVVGIGGGAQAANFGISISGGYESELCNMGFVAKFLKAGDPRLDKLVDAMYNKVMYADTPEGPASYSSPDN